MPLQVALGYATVFVMNKLNLIKRNCLTTLASQRDRFTIPLVVQHLAYHLSSF